MWLPKTAFDLFKISRDTVDAQREELAQVRAERDSLKAQLATTQANFEWIRTRVNQLEIERAQLIEHQFGIKTAIPEISRTTSKDFLTFNSDLFEDVGDDKAKELGFPVYGK